MLHDATRTSQIEVPPNSVTKKADGLVTESSNGVLPSTDMYSNILTFPETNSKRP